MLARPFIYLSQAQVDAFVEEACEKLIRIDQLVWQIGAKLDGRLSALELLPEFRPG